jgi:hypothetical protein
MNSTLFDDYKEMLAEHIQVSIDDLTENEQRLIQMSWNMFNSKLDSIKVLEDDVKRLNIELVNEKAMNDDSEKYTDDGGYCPTCGRENEYNLR